MQRSFKSDIYIRTYPSTSSYWRRFKAQFLSPLRLRERDYLWWKNSRPRYILVKTNLFRLWKHYRYERMMLLRILHFIQFKHLSPISLPKHADVHWMAYLVRHSTYLTFTHINFRHNNYLATSKNAVSSRFI